MLFYDYQRPVGFLLDYEEFYCGCALVFAGLFLDEFSYLIFDKVFQNVNQNCAAYACKKYGISF